MFDPLVNRCIHELSVRGSAAFRPLQREQAHDFGVVRKLRDCRHRSAVNGALRYRQHLDALLANWKSITLLLGAGILLGCATDPKWKRQVFAFSLPDDPPATNAQTHIVALSRVSISPLFQSRSFTYRKAENTYEQDPYAGFLVPPERALAEPIRAWMRASGVFGRVLEPGSRLTPTLVAEVSVNELYGDFRQASRPVGKMEIHFICYEVKDGDPGRIVLDRVCSHETPLARKTPDALMAAWDADLHKIMEEINSEYSKANSKDR